MQLPSHEKAVRLSVRPSVKRMYCDKKEESSAQIFYTTSKIIYPSFLIRMFGGGDPFYPKF